MVAFLIKYLILFMKTEQSVLRLQKERNGV